MDRYVVIGNPVAHSLSPAIHRRFAEASGERLEYARLEAPLGGFAAVARRFFAQGGRGANVTLPFKMDAFDFADRASERSARAGACNFLVAREGRVEGDNTDGAGLVADLTGNLRVALRNATVLILGAGGAARGVIAPLLECGPARLVIANRTVATAEALAARFADLGRVEPSGLERIDGGPFDLVVNATSAARTGAGVAVPEGVAGASTLAYDMGYGDSARPFLEAAAALGARTADGLGMLVEQAAESFALWRGKRPATAPVLEWLRRGGA